MPSPPLRDRIDFPFLRDAGFIPFSHRGANLQADENTWSAFESAVAGGYQYLETDVRGTRDGVAVVGHDDSLKRVFGVESKVSELSLAELETEYQKHHLGEVLTLRSLLQRLPSARFNIDIKSQSALEDVVSVLQDTDSVRRVCIASFSDRRLREARRRLGPDACTAVGPLGVALILLLSRLPRVVWPKSLPIAGAALQVPLRFRTVPVLSERMILLAHRVGFVVHVWTINDGPLMEKLIDWEVDGIMTDEPGLLRKVLEARGMWPKLVP